MKQLFDSCNGLGRAVAWTVFYVFLMWVILYGLFNFNIFSVAHWVRLRAVELHGFPGLVFGILILAAVPLYVATTVLTMRNKSAPIKIPLPNCLAPVPPKVEDTPRQPIVTEQETLPELRPGVPPEMRESFMRAKKNYGSRQMSVFNKPMAMRAVDIPNAAPTPSPVVAGGEVAVGDVSGGDVSGGAFPVPTDFDVAPLDDTDYGVPVFSDVNFDEADDADSDGKSPVDDLCEFLIGAGHNATHTDNDLIAVDNFIIAVHDDDDFWVADDADWFAAGKQKPSPIVALNNACAANGEMHPVLYLGEHNIMDFDELSQKWRADGIEIVTDRDELLKMIQNA
ncbi:MAG: hypothetical protein IJQ90_04775 [Alphaproteobacteria bacterium]|nr:hypothetical protein [Alphaproteobacteria bacterium]